MKRKKAAAPEPEHAGIPALTGLSRLLAAPLESLAEADFRTSLAALRLIAAHGFEADGEGEPQKGHLGSLRTLSFLCPPGGAGADKPNLVRIPALSLLPLPLLQIAEAEVEMGVRLVRPTAPGEDSESPPGSGAGWQAMLAPAPQRGRRAREGDARHGANLTVKVRVRQADLPAGAATLLQVLGQSASSAPYPREASR